MIKLQTIKPLVWLAPLALLLTACPTFSLVSPSFTYNNNFNNAGNPNGISCDPGNWYSSAYCSIPLPKFVGITAQYIDPYSPNLLLDYDIHNNSFVFGDLAQITTLQKLNQQFLKNYPVSENFAQLSTSVQKLYAVLKDDYIPNNNYQKQSEAYTFIYTLSALHFATEACSDLNRPLPFVTQDDYRQKYMFYKAFSMQYANAVLHHLSAALDSKYNNEVDLYNHLYNQLLKLNPYQLDNLAQEIYGRTINYAPAFESSLYTSEGVDFGELGNFSCSDQATSWRRFGFEFFGINVSGLLHSVSFKNKDDFKSVDGHLIPVSQSTPVAPESSAATVNQRGKSSRLNFKLSDPN